MMMANATKEDSTVFKDINYNKDDLKQIKLSALVYDIGKLSIPEYIIDKSKKLEGICGRIEFIKLRIEIIKKSLLWQLLKERYLRMKLKKSSKSWIIILKKCT